MSRFAYCNADCRYAECCYAERRYAEHRYAERRYAEHRYAERRYAECRYAECWGTDIITFNVKKLMKFSRCVPVNVTIHSMKK